MNGWPDSIFEGFSRYTCALIKTSRSVRSKLQPRWGTPTVSPLGGKESPANPVADDGTMAHAEDPLDVAETDGLHPPGAPTTLEALDYRGRCALNAETIC